MFVQRADDELRFRAWRPSFRASGGQRAIDERRELRAHEREIQRASDEELRTHEHEVQRARDEARLVKVLQSAWEKLRLQCQAPRDRKKRQTSRGRGDGEAYGTRVSLNVFMRV